MDTNIIIKLGFVIDGVYFGYISGKLYQLPYNKSGRYYGLREIKPKDTKGGIWKYYRIRRKKVGNAKLAAMLKSVSWEVAMPVDLK
jgi:hypothetical protein